MNIEDYLLNGKLRSYSSVGSYPLVYLAGSLVLCPSCANENQKRIQQVAVNWQDPNLHCGECGDRIESAYAEEENTDV